MSVVQGEKPDEYAKEGGWYSWYFATAIAHPQVSLRRVPSEGETEEGILRERCRMIYLHAVTRIYGGCACAFSDRDESSMESMRWSQAMGPGLIGGWLKTDKSHSGKRDSACWVSVLKFWEFMDCNRMPLPNGSEYHDNRPESGQRRTKSFIQIAVPAPTLSFYSNVYRKSWRDFPF